MPLEVEAEIQERLVNNAEVDECKRDDEPPEPAVSVEIGVDRFELGMGSGNSHERKLAAAWNIEVPLEVGETVTYARGRRWNIARIPWARTANPILCGADNSRLPLPAASVLEQTSMDFIEEPRRKRQVLDTNKSKSQRADIIGDLDGITVGRRVTILVFEEQHVGERGLRSLDLRREERLFPEVHENEEVRVRNHLGDSVEASEGRARLVIEQRIRAREFDRRTRDETTWDERSVTFAGDGYQPSSPLAEVAAPARCHSFIRNFLIKEICSNL